MNWEKIISRRFYKSPKIQGRKIGYFSMIGMGIGCFAMIISLSVMNGFETLVHGKLKGFEGEITILGKFSDIPNFNISGIDNYIPFIERRAVIESNQLKRVVSIKAIDEKKMEEFYQFPFRGKSPNSGQVAIGQDLAYRLSKDIGDFIFAYSPIDQAIGFDLPFRKKLEISGVFSTKVLDYDDQFVFITIEDGKNLFKRKIGYDGIHLRIASEKDLKQIKFDLEKQINHDIVIKSWDEKNRSLVDAMKMERLGTLIILCLIFLVAAFNLAASLTLISIQKMKEVSVLKVMGTSKRSILKILVRLGLNQAGKGALLGYLAGIIVVLIQNQFSLIPIPSDIYFIDTLPMELSINDIILVFILSLIFIFGSSFIAGRKVAYSNLKDGLQWVK